MISSPADRKKFKDAIQEISNSMTRKEAESDLIREVVKELNSEFQLPKKIINKIAKTYHRQNFTQEIQENEDFETLYEEVTGVQKSA
jgi:Zn-dependent M32 family carboxypeptidase